MSVQRLLACLMFAGLLLACHKEEAPRETQATAPPQEKVDCTQVMEWIRERPLSKRCETDADCTLQRDNCCDITAVRTSYAINCERTCRETCPQDSTIGQSLAHSAVCRNHTCDVALSATAEMPAKTTP